MSDENGATYLAVTNWESYQHYSDREPVWIKLHTATLHDRKVRSLPPMAQLLWYDMLQLAGYYRNAVLNSPEAIARETGIPVADTRVALNKLLDAGLLRITKTSRRASTAALRKRKTGWRRTKSLAAEHYERHPDGTDRPPPWWK